MKTISAELLEIVYNEWPKFYEKFSGHDLSTPELFKLLLDFILKAGELKLAADRAAAEIELTKIQGDKINNEIELAKEKNAAELALAKSQENLNEMEKLARKIEARAVLVSVNDNLQINQLNAYSNVFASIANASNSGASFTSHLSNIVQMINDIQGHGDFITTFTPEFDKIIIKESV